jgi:2-polyprenyl-3-methyl-5-hydroxy-6-metoxy-1,4-benzoquinol methylase
MNKHFREKFVADINSRGNKYKLVKSKYGHFYISPMPDDKELHEHYRTKYYSDPLAAASKGIDIGSQDERERHHYDRQYNEVVAFIDERNMGRDIKILDVGCGMGGFLKHLKSKGFVKLYGTEFNPPLNLKQDGITVFPGDFLELEIDDTFDFINFNNVLEHVKFPELVLQKAHAMLNGNGYIRVQVPNDLSFTQYLALKDKKKANYYFINPPEHLHYFDFESMENMLNACGFQVARRMTNWSMDLFILMGLDYSENPLIGKECHGYRLNLECGMQEDFLLEFYKKMAELEIGRSVIEYARKM